VAAVLWTRFLRYSLEDPTWPGRDRFVLSAGHGSMLLYGLLHLAGFKVSLEDLKSFRQLGSNTPGHPEWGETEGVEVTTGPLGQGFGNGVGMALGAQMEAARYRNPLLRSRVFGIVSDGDLMEGVCCEAASLAGHLQLGNIVYLYDDNRITIEGSTELAFSEDVGQRFAALGWHVQQIDGHDFGQIQGAIDRALVQDDKPNLIICRTHIAKGSPNKQDTHGAHGAPLGEQEIQLTKAALGLPPDPFHVDEELRRLFAERARENEGQRRQWLESMGRWEGENPDLATEHRRFRDRTVPGDLLEQLVAAAGDKPAATRALSGAVIQKAAELVPSLVTGSADLDPSTKTRIVESSSVTAGNREGRNLHYGIREHAMGAILNGMALHGGYLAVGSTFLTFSDYMRPAVRLAALTGLPVGFVYTHDSILLGEDGPTHQPVEHVASLRLIPNLHVFRPADGAEVAAAWTCLLSRRDGPTALVLTRQGVPNLTRPDSFRHGDMLRGAYVVHEPDGEPTAVVMASGAEVAPVIQASQTLAGRGIALRVVSAPCLELLASQDPAYREELLPTGLPVLAVEMGRPESWCQFTGAMERVFGVSRFGASAPANALAREFGFTPEQLADWIAGRLTQR
jgi:transketolase